MSYSTPQQLRFPPLAGYTVRADFAGGVLSSDFGALLLRGIDRQIGLTDRLAAAIQDKRHPSYIDYPLRDLLAQRIYQIASGYADGNDANSLRHDPLFNPTTTSLFDMRVTTRYVAPAYPRAQQEAAHVTSQSDRW
jgi:Transposase DDE domain group 1